MNRICKSYKLLMMRVTYFKKNILTKESDSTGIPPSKFLVRENLFKTTNIIMINYH